MKINTNEVDLIIKNTIGIPLEYREQFFQIEHETFHKTYKRCPKTLVDFDKRYSGRSLILAVCLIKNEVIGQRTFEIIDDDLAQSMFMVVEKNYRSNKLSKLICSVSAEYFKWLNIKYIASWTHIDITAARIMSKYVPFISEGDVLNDEELMILRKIEHYEKKDVGYFGITRRVKDYYTMIDNNQTGDAYFWVHKL